MSKGQSQPRMHSRSRALGRCKNKSVEIIDVDKGKDVVVIDAPGSSCQGSGCTRTRSSDTSTVVILIDDEDGDIYATPKHAGQSSLNSGPSPLYYDCVLEKELDNNGSHVFSVKNLNPPGMARRGQQPRFGSSRRHYDVYSSSESSSSESDGSACDAYEGGSSDCEVLDDSFGIIREQWERAAVRRKLSHTVRVSLEDQASASGSNAEGSASAEHTQNMVNFDDCVDESFSEHLKASTQQCGPSRSINEENFIPDMPNGNEVEEDPAQDNNRKAEYRADCDKTGINCEAPNFNQEKSIHESNVPGAQYFETYVDCNETSTTDEQMLGNIHASVYGSAFMEKSGNSPSTSALRVETNIQDGGSCPGHLTKILDPEHCTSDFVSFKNQGEHIIYTQPQLDSSVYHDINGQENDKSFTEQSLFNDPRHGELGTAHGNDCFDFNIEDHRGESTSKNETGNTFITGLSLHRIVNNESIVKQDVSYVQSDITIDREKHKESEEYKRAAEEEWASRIREIQIQADEAQKLRKRRRAESLRLLNMEKRQKQRLEEVRESQRKDEETINLKEQLRDEVRKELDKLERMYNDMASLLRGLGIPVEGGAFPLSHEVNAAYKQALLRFHPDRASRTDIRKQIEAEEKFKMISRLKEKLLPVS